MAEIFVTCTSTGETRPVNSLLFEFRKHGEDWTIEYSGKRMLRLLCSIEAILLAYSCTEVNALDLFLNIHGVCASGVIFPVSYDGHTNWAREQSMVAELLAAVFSVNGTKARDSMPAHLVLTERSFSRITPKTGATWTILEFAEECANAPPAPSLSVMIKSQGQDTPKTFEFVGDRSWMLRWYALNVD